MKKDLRKELDKVIFRINYKAGQSLSEGFFSKYKKDIKQITEAIEYDDDDDHRMHPDIESKLRDRGHHLGDHPSFPASDDHHFEEKIASKRFKDNVSKAKTSLNTDRISQQHMMQGMMLIQQIMQIETEHQGELEKLAVKLVKEEFNLDDDTIDFEAMMTRDIDTEGMQDEPCEDCEFEPDSLEDGEELDAETRKYQLLQSLQQGASKKGHYMYHVITEELNKIDPRLVGLYSKIMPIADIMYWMVPDSAAQTGGGGMQTAGKVQVEFPKEEEEGEKPKVIAKAWIFPVLVHELIKGVFEILNSHSLPEDSERARHILDKSEHLNAEMWDLRLGPGLWEKFTEAIGDDDWDLRYYLYYELAKMPAKEFHSFMKEVFSGSPKGKRELDIIAKKIREEHGSFDAEEALEKMNPDLPFGPDEIDDIDLSDLGLDL